MLQQFFINSFDYRVADWFLTNRSDIGTKIFSVITFFGNWQLLLPVIFVIVLILFIKKKKEFIIPFIGVVFIAEAITLFGKIWFQRPRPLLAIFTETGFAFPSGHATIAVTFYGYLAYILIRLLRDKYKWLVVTMSIIIIVLIGFSRLYLSVHYLSDVLAGYFVGMLALIIAIIYSDRYYLKRKKEKLKK